MEKTTFEAERRAWFEANGVAVEPRWITDSDGRRIYALVAGSGEPTTLLVHGGLGDLGPWANLAGRLGEGTVVMVDRPGCGMSYPIDYTGLDYRREAAAFLQAVVEGLGVEQVDLVGNSMGGFFSVCFALAHPERVRRLVLLGAPAGIDRWVPPYIKALGTPGLGRVVQWLTGTTDPEVVRANVFDGMLVAHADRVDARMLKLGATCSAWAESQLAARTMLRRFVTWRGLRDEVWLRDDLVHLEVPTLFAWGERDHFAPPESGEELAARMPAAELVRLPDLGHLPWLDDPEACATPIRAFLGRAEPQEAAQAS